MAALDKLNRKMEKIDGEINEIGASSLRIQIPDASIDGSMMNLGRGYYSTKSLKRNLNLKRRKFGLEQSV
jgi:hypothetical protein